jgi:hypothetical protein
MNGPKYPERAVYVVDWDDTCVEEYDENGNRYWPESGPWKKGAPEALRWLSDRGKTVVYTMRTHLYEMDDTTRRWYSDVSAQRDLIRGMLDRADLHDIEIYDVRRGKPPGEFYIDDKAVRFRGRWAGVIEEIVIREGMAGRRR